MDVLFNAIKTFVHVRVSFGSSFFPKINSLGIVKMIMSYIIVTRKEMVMSGNDITYFVYVMFLP